ncbi:MAG: membrane protein insertion efficiency factor YidD [Halanaerobiales bacterium]
MKKIIIGLIKLYQKIISPITPGSCRFYPTCSSYMRQAVDKYGVIPGIWKGIRRIFRCHPFNPGGYDPLE